MSNSKLVSKKEDQDQEIDPELLNKNLSTFFEREGELLTKEEFERIQNLTMRGKSLESEIDSYRSDLKITKEGKKRLKIRNTVRTAINHLSKTLKDLHNEYGVVQTQNILSEFSQLERETYPSRILNFLNMAGFQLEANYTYEGKFQEYSKQIRRLKENFNGRYPKANQEKLARIDGLLNIEFNRFKKVLKKVGELDNASIEDILVIAITKAMHNLMNQKDLIQCQNCGELTKKESIIEASLMSPTLKSLHEEKFIICRKCVCEVSDIIEEVNPLQCTLESLKRYYFCGNCGSKWSKDELLVYVDEHDNKLAHLCPLCYWNEFIPGDIVAEDEKLMQDLHETYEKIDWEPLDRKAYQMIIKGSPIEFSPNIVKVREEAYEKMDKKKEEID